MILLTPDELRQVVAEARRRRRSFWMDGETRVIHLASTRKDVIQIACGRRPRGKMQLLGYMSSVTELCEECAKGTTALSPPVVGKAPPKFRRTIAMKVKRGLVGVARAKCEICGHEPNPQLVDRVLHAHHIIPVAKGGKNDPENLAIVCANCHAVAHAMWKMGRKRPWTGPKTREQFIKGTRAWATSDFSEYDPFAAVMIA